MGEKAKAVNFLQRGKKEEQENFKDRTQRYP
jgi:hypothetical protein